MQSVSCQVLSSKNTHGLWLDRTRGLTFNSTGRWDREMRDNLNVNASIYTSRCDPTAPRTSEISDWPGGSSHEVRSIAYLALAVALCWAAAAVAVRRHHRKYISICVGDYHTNRPTRTGKWQKSMMTKSVVFWKLPAMPAPGDCAYISYSKQQHARIVTRIGGE